MPPINDFVCHTCRKSIHQGWGSYMYVTTTDGERIICPHPEEHTIIAQVLNLTLEEVIFADLESNKAQEKPPWWWSRKRRAEYEQANQLLAERTRLIAEQRGKLIEERTGYQTFCICFECKESCYLDVGCAMEGEPISNPRDKRQCPTCGAENVKTLYEMIGEPCPLCGEGRIEEIVTGAMA